MTDAATNAWGEETEPNPVAQIIALRTAQVGAVTTPLIIALCAATSPPLRFLTWATTSGAVSLALSAYFAATFRADFTLPGASLMTRLPPSAGNAVALTFDDGPHPDTTPRLLDALATANARATFFVVGERASQYPNLVARIVAGGHALGIHGLRHRTMALSSATEIRRDLAAATARIEAAAGRSLPRPLLLRPPYGFKTLTLVRAAQGADCVLVAWSLDGRDYASGGADAITRRISARLAPRDIILLHERPGDPATANAMPALLALCLARNLRSVPIGGAI